MVKELVQRVEREKLFDVVGMAVVSQTPNIKKIQGDIASWLKLKLDDENELKRAGELRQGLINHGIKNKGRNKWDDTLQQLKNSNLQGVSRDVFSRIELSYKLLEAEEAKSCFLLCSLFPEDFNILEDLVRYGMGLRLFKNVDKVHHARTRVYNLIDELKESFLLLEGDGHDYVKMHDIVRDVAISIASRDKQWHTLQSEAKMNEWREEDGYKHCIAISLLYEKISGQLNDLEYPKLELLQIGDDCWSPGLPNNVYAGMK
ncbi:hypothetical protein GH714_016618 [Hevea brasiliensis]|uniref:NB-ARC domain-containing protein n=1 Tax=Hevea brasiliensis TaxID=3981 RepID=A0A6A6KQX4_HEVBR|nr:hypothetical protein GH714_016618 [Hevea brasiliensis]